ncbi:antichymotrypsin-2-like [Anticarsia gemmatalis]|uniref:antichymotrypsin-2-like n=1 Tax=Anticarsia gemmatalis TaxID=129554 RepID=UPI003F76285C
MMLIISLVLSCFILNVQPQNYFGQSPYYPQYRNPDNIYFPGRTNALPLTLGVTDPQTSQDVLKQIFGEAPKKNTAVEIERSNEILVSSVEEVTQRQSAPALGSNRPVTIPVQPTRQEAITQRTGHLVQAAAVRPQTVPPVAPKTAPGYNGLLYSVTNFGINLLKNINSVQPGNAVVSPYSITSLLALLQQGALGQTQEQITTALQMSPAVSAAAYSQISTDYKNRNSRNILRTANNVFVGDAFSLNRDFKKVAQNSFDSDITPVAFGNSERAAQLINSWVASKTNNKIERLVSPDALGSSTQAVLVNAVYFKGLWEIPFRVEATLPREFHLSNGQTKTIPFMRIRRLIRTGVDPATGAKVLVLPFERNQYSLMVILPSQSEGVTGALSTLTDARLLSYLSFAPVDTELELPKFTVRADTNLASVLRNMGISKMFGPYAELNGLGTYQAFSPQISSAVHSAVLSIDEQGGSAAAATAFAAVALSYDEPAVLFKADRPFIAVLWDTATSLPLFMAKIEDPQL